MGKIRLVILGTGWGSFSVLRNLKKSLYEVTVVSPRNYFLFTPLLTGTTVGTLEFRSIIEPIRKSRFRPQSHNFHMVRATGWDMRNQIVQCRSLLSPDTEYPLQYDKLVIGVGMLPNTFNIPGVKEHTFFLKEVSDARKIRNRLIHNFELSVKPGISEEEKRRLLHIVIVGGGPTGVEFGAELYDFLQEDISRLFNQRKSDVRVTLIEGKQILGAFDPGLQKYAEDKIKARENFRLVTDTVSEVRHNGVLLSNGNFIPCGLVVWSAGLAPNEFTNSLPDTFKNRQGQIITDDYLRVIADDSQNSYALGDCATIPTQPLPATAQVANRQGIYLAQALNFEGSGKGLYDVPFKHVGRGMLVYIGGYRALSDLPEFKLKGFLSWFLWRSTYLSQLASWRLKVQVPMDWLKTILFGRDTSRLE